jgi:hypothetical protein
MQTPVARVQHGRDSQQPVKARLERLARQLRERLPSSGESSRDYYLKSFQGLTDISSGTNAVTRLECLETIFLYFYSSNDRTTALRVGRAFVSLACKTELKPWIRKSKTFLGIALADSGDVNDAVVEYREALRIASV